MAVLPLKQQNNQSNAQWYEKLNARVDIAKSLGVQFNNFLNMWTYCCEAKGWNEYGTLNLDDQDTIQSELKERLLAYLLIINSSHTATHKSVKNNLLEAFITKRDEYLKTQSNAIALLNKYDERKLPPATAASKGITFAQKGKKKTDEKKKKDDGNQDKSKSPDIDYWKDKECFFCSKKGHPAAKCPSTKKSNDADNLSSISSKSNKLEELEKKFKKQFTQLKAQLEQDDEVSDSEDEKSHFQFTQHFSLFNHYVPPIECHNEVTLKQSKGKLGNLNLQEVILLDNQSTMSLFCNCRMVSNVSISDEPLTLRSNGGT